MENRYNFSVLGVLLNLPLAQKGVSATSNLLLTGLQKSGNLYKVIDVEINGIIRGLLIARNFHPNISHWRFKYHLDPLARKARSIKASSLLQHDRGNYDAVIQIGSEFDLSSIQKLKGIPKFSYHDSNLIMYLNGAWALPKATHRIQQALKYEHQVYENLTGIFTMTKCLRDVFINEFNVPKDKVFHVGLGVNLEDYSGSEKEYDGKTILFVARHIFEQKGGRVLLEAFKIVRKEIKDARLLLVGQHLNISDAGVECIGFIDKSTEEGRKKLSYLYKKSSLFVMPSFYDAVGNVFLEAMSHRLPCIGADCCAMPELIVENNAGCVIPPGDSEALAKKIIYLLKDTKAMAEMGENGRRAVIQKYNWRVVTQKVLRIIEHYVK